MRQFLAIALFVALPALAADEPAKPPLIATKTDRISVASPGTIHLQNSFGEVSIDGWDRPEVEITTRKSAEYSYGAAHRDEASRRLESVSIAIQHEGNDVTIATTYPPLNAITHPFSRRSDIDIEYDIKAPRGSKLLVDHNSGEINVADMTGDIHASVTDGQITLTLPDGQYAIDAKCKIGQVNSDFEGTPHRHMLGENFDGAGKPPARNLYLRVGAGDIIILKMFRPPTPTD